MKPLTLYLYFCALAGTFVSFVLGLPVYLLRQLGLINAEAHQHALIEVVHLPPFSDYL